MHKKTVIDFKELKKRYSFRNPICELIAKDIQQVGSVLEKVEEYQEKGLYVVGYLSYEAAAFFDKHLKTHPTNLAGEYYAYFTVHDHVEMSEIPISYSPVAMPNSWKELTDSVSYHQAIDRIHHHIRQGDTYQVNYTVQLKQELLEDSFDIYNRMVVEQEAGFNAYVLHDETAIISMSPELFFKKSGQKLVTRPMKGTLKRGKNLKEDQANCDWLAADPKNRAENMMIVDLLRNDMGKICQTGSVQVTKLCQIEQYSTVWQMTSTIEGELKKDSHLYELFQSLYPCGSITGAPKISTMSIINQLEPNPRGVYCGTIGIALPNGDSIWNVAIRTIQLTRQEAYYGVGGGITWDSNWKSEYEETKQKSSVLYRQQPRFNLLTTGKIKQGQLLFEQEHFNRLEASARYFAYPFQKEILKEKLQQTLASLEHSKEYRLRIQLNKKGDFTLEVEALTPLSKDYLRANLVVRDKKAADSAFTHFKTTYRPHIPTSLCEQIFITEDGVLLEASIGNLVLELEGNLYTPSLEFGILDGIYRQMLVAEGRVKEKILTLDDLAKAERIYLCNAVRGLYEIQLA